MEYKNAVYVKRNEFPRSHHKNMYLEPSDSNMATTIHVGMIKNPSQINQMGGKMYGSFNNSDYMSMLTGLSTDEVYNSMETAENKCSYVNRYMKSTKYQDNSNDSYIKRMNHDKKSKGINNMYYYGNDIEYRNNQKIAQDKSKMDKFFIYKMNQMPPYHQQIINSEIVFGHPSNHAGRKPVDILPMLNHCVDNKECALKHEYLPPHLHQRQGQYQSINDKKRRLPPNFNFDDIRTYYNNI